MDETEYATEYRRDVLGKLDPAKAAADLGSDAVLLCWESPGEFLSQETCCSLVGRGIRHRSTRICAVVREVIKSKIFKMY